MIKNDIIYNISEIFFSIQGEGTRVGLPCVFVRFQGCNLRCNWCDTPYALELNQKEFQMTADEIIEKVKSYNCNFIEFTGGEPLAQENSYLLINYFAELGYTVAIETNGYYSFEKLHPNVIKIMDIKCPGSKMSKFNKIENTQFLTKKDEVKFVVLNKDDFDWAVNLINQQKLFEKVDTILISPVFGKLEYVSLANWILSSGLPLKMQLQIHKFIWHPETRGV